jgi:hypothetical protein
MGADRDVDELAIDRIFHNLSFSHGHNNWFQSCPANPWPRWRISVGRLLFNLPYLRLRWISQRHI